MKTNFRLSEAALNDLANIWKYTLDNWSLEQADRYYTLLVDECQYVSTHFESGKPIDDIKKGYRASKVKSHIIFYRKAADGIIEIIRILHQRMDIRTRLKAG